MPTETTAESPPEIIKNKETKIQQQKYYEHKPKHIGYIYLTIRNNKTQIWRIQKPLVSNNYYLKIEDIFEFYHF